MNRLAELLAALRAEEAMPEDWDAQISEAYEYDMSVPTAKISDLETALAAKDAEITALKVHNYELLMGAGPVEDEPAEDTAEDVEEDFTTEDLFGDVDEEKEN